MGSVQVRLPVEQLERWRATAEQAGLSLSEFVRGAVEDKITDRGSAAIARAVSRDLLPEIERMLAAHAVTGEPTEGSFKVQHFERFFDRGCLDADLHTPGQLCSGCGGSRY